MNSVQTNVPVRVRANKGFYANIQGQYGVVNPGDVVDLDRQLAAMMISANKAVQVPSDTKLVRDTDYKPERLKNPQPTSEDRLDKLQGAVEQLAGLVAQLVATQASASTAGRAK